ncbi:tonB family protein [Plesiocystis pacifica SIR-1]|uniref:TonB family protein n=1 Tax=Plesiocystis pacifica SIR-1 TaxID=391625 RepID=A6G761_9BACT|nr:carboxypeptidase-like regulatory domain-containing protein [Plesiocystis pacifica]EDM78337.1 tonB family protein [Plesiocystis pacifica SIR-1]
MALAGLGSGAAEAASPPPPSEPEPAVEDEPDPPPEVEVRGRVIEAGSSRRPVAAAVIMVVAAPPEARVGKAAREPLDPEAVTWMRRAESDDEGRFVLDEVPAGTVRVIVVAGGYARYEVFEAVTVPEKEGAGEALVLRLRPDAASEYRTEVRSLVPEEAEAPEYVLDGDQARHYAGSGGEPLVAAMNLPGVARSPGGLGLLALRGATPTWTGYYVDGHPVPRGFHIVPVASVVYPAAVDRVALHPGSYPAAFGGFGGGLVVMDTAPGCDAWTERGLEDEPACRGAHGEAHIDLFDVGAHVEAPVGRGAVSLAVRRSHVDAVAGLADRIASRAVGQESGAILGSLLIPAYWDYHARFDIPLGRGTGRGPYAAPRQLLSLRALGAGDNLVGEGLSAEDDEDDLDFWASFHRFDLEYRAEGRDWRALISPSLRLDSNSLRQYQASDRTAWVGSWRMLYAAQVHEAVELEAGVDVVYESWRRSQLSLDPDVPVLDPLNPPDLDMFGMRDDFAGEKLRAGMWLTARVQLGEWELVPGLRANLFEFARRQQVNVEPRLHVRGQVHRRVAVIGSAGMFGVPVVLRSSTNQLNALPSVFPYQGGYVDLPNYLTRYFDPGVEGDLVEGTLGLTRVIQASAGVELRLPWELDARGTLYWREGLAETLVSADSGNAFPVPRQRGMGAELYLGRPLGPRLDGWLGYTLSWSRIEDTRTGVGASEGVSWVPAVFDQRHNFVALVSAALPRGFRLGARFRVVSGNPDRVYLGTDNFDVGLAWTNVPLQSVRGTTYRPLFHQLDLRLDKRWTKRNTVVGVYLDVQNVYNNLYPEAWIYSADFSVRTGSFGLPIYPSLGVSVEF